jgi:hypothetical protein
MQKISTYLYPNRIELLADLASFNVEYTNVYQRIVKIYNGIDNTIEFDVKNADQKRIDLTTLSGIEMHVMDANGNALPNSPYTVTPTSIKGIATVLVPQEDLADLGPQFLKFSVNASKDGADIMLYGDTRFGALGKMELVGSAMPTFRDPIEYTSFHGELTGNGSTSNAIHNYHSSAIPVKFYEAVPTTNIDVTVEVTDFIGTIHLEATKHTTISSEAFKNSIKATQVFDSSRSDPVVFADFPIGQYAYFRITYIKSAGTVDKVIV